MATAGWDISTLLPDSVANEPVFRGMVSPLWHGRFDADLPACSETHPPNFDHISTVPTTFQNVPGAPGRRAESLNGTDHGHPDNPIARPRIAG